MPEATSCPTAVDTYWKATGRMKKPTANTANVDSSGTSELSALLGTTWSAM